MQRIHLMIELRCDREMRRKKTLDNCNINSQTNHFTYFLDLSAHRFLFFFDLELSFGKDENGTLGTATGFTFRGRIMFMIISVPFFFLDRYEQ